MPSPVTTTISARQVSPAPPGRLSLMTLSLAAALSTWPMPQAWALDTPTSTTSYSWDSGTDIDVSISNGVTIGGASIGTGLHTGSNNTGLGTLTNQGLITGSITGLLFGSGGNATLIDNGTLGTIDGGILLSSTLTTLNNSGTISASNTAIINTATISTLTNSGLISGTFGIRNYRTIDTMVNTGTIAGSSSSPGFMNGAYTSASNGTVASIASLVNSGLISSAGVAFYNHGTIATLSNSGTIHGGSYGMANLGSIGVLSNSGTITGNNSGLLNGNVFSTIADTISHIQTLTNTGLITGGAGLVNAGRIDTLNNSGTITGTFGALYNISTIGNVVNSGVIAGTILNLSTAAFNVSGGSGTTFGTLTGVNGSIGKLYSTSDVNFNGGNQLLNDDIGLGASFGTGGTIVTTGLGTVTNSGSVLQINNHITITGNYQQNAAATLAIGASDAAVANGVSADTGYGRLIVTGNATVDSGSSVTLKKLNTYSFATGQRFVVIQAATATYNASTLVYTVAGYSATGATVVDGSDQDLVVTIGAATGSTLTNGATDNSSTGVFKGLFNYTGVNQSLLNVFNPALALTDSTQANQAGQRLSPTATKGAASSGAQAAANAVGGAANDRIDTQRGGGGDSGVATGESTLSPALWGRAFGGRANQGTRDGISGFHANYGGVLIGGDALVNPDWRVGGLFSYARTNVGNDGTNSGSSASVNAYGLMAYAGFDGKPWYLNLTAGVSRQNYSSTRDISFTGFSGIANGSYNGSVITASAQAGYPLDVGATTVTPLAGLKYSGLRQGGYTESGGSGAALTVNGSTSSSIKSEIGVKVEQSFLTSYGMLKPSMQLGWNHEFRDTRQTTSASFAADTTGSTAFTTLGVTPLKDTAQLSLGVALLQSKNLTVSARYTVEAASGYTAQTGDLTLRWQY